MNQPAVLDGLKCVCGAPHFPTIDRQGTHLITECNGVGNYRLKLHGAMEDEIMAIGSNCEFRVRREERDCFKIAFPDCNKRPDVTFVSKNLITDISVKQPYSTRCGLSLQQALTVERAANEGFKGKNRKYGAIAEDNNLNFLPLIFETTGRIQKDALLEMDTWFKHGSDVRKIDKGVLSTYWLRSISCKLQKIAAQAIIQRSFKMASDLNPFLEDSSQAHARSYEAMMLFDYVNSGSEYHCQQ